jgi:hypothetical protein
MHMLLNVAGVKAWLAGMNILPYPRQALGGQYNAHLPEAKVAEEASRMAEIARFS